MNSGVVHRSDALIDRRSVRTEPSGRDWAGIGVGLVAAFAMIGVYAACIWAVLVLVEALF